MPRPASPDSGLRADAERNRQRIVDSARSAFAEQGLEVSTNEIARRAGVGVATLFRRFPTREELVAAAFSDKMREYSSAIDMALAQGDPWLGFCEYVRSVASMQAGDRGFNNLMTQSFPTAKEFEALRREAYNRVLELIDRAKAAGGLRADFVAEDLPLLLMANAGVVSATADSAPEASPRLVAYLLQSFAAANTEPLPPAPTPRRMYRALMRLHKKAKPSDRAATGP